MGRCLSSVEWWAVLQPTPATLALIYVRVTWWCECVGMMASGSAMHQLAKCVSQALLYMYMYVIIIIVCLYII